MDKKTFDNLIAFLNRTNIQGSEVQAYVECLNAITKLYENQNNKAE